MPAMWLSVVSKDSGWQTQLSWYLCQMQITILEQEKGEVLLVTSSTKCSSCGHSGNVHDWTGSCWSKYNQNDGARECECEEFVK